MQPIRRAPRGLLLLCVALSLTACSSSGDKRLDLPATETRIVEAARTQLVPISTTLTDVPPLAGMPVPEIPYGMAGCYRAGGCLSNRQFDQALSAALDWGSRSADNLRAIRKAGESAVNPKEPTK